MLLKDWHLQRAKIKPRSTRNILLNNEQSNALEIADKYMQQSASMESRGFSEADIFHHVSTQAREVERVAVKV